MTKFIPDNTGKTYNTNKKLNPRAMMFRQFFIDPTSKTFWNVYGSAVRAGYSKEYSENISSNKPKWFVELMESAEYRRAEMLELSEKNMRRVLKDVPDNDAKAKMQLDTSKFVSERVGKDHYSTRKELTDKGGKRLFNNTHTKDSQGAISDLFINVDADTGA